MSKKEIELKYFTCKGKYSSFKSETARQENKTGINPKQKSIDAVKAFDNLFKK